jgi:hypothetical protein
VTMDSVLDLKLALESFNGDFEELFKEDRNGNLPPKSQDQNSHR